MQNPPRLFKVFSKPVKQKPLMERRGEDLAIILGDSPLRSSWPIIRCGNINQVDHILTPHGNVSIYLPRVRFTAMESKQIGLASGVRQCFCPSCGSIFIPPTSSVKVRKKRKGTGKRRRKEEWLHKPQRCKSCLTLHCKVCRKSFRVSEPSWPWRYQGAGGQTPPAVSSLLTPTPKPARNVSTRRRSSTLKAVLQKTSQEQQLRLQEMTASPKLRQFLTELK